MLRYGPSSGKAWGSSHPERPEATRPVRNSVPRASPTPSGRAPAPARGRDPAPPPAPAPPPRGTYGAGSRERQSESGCPCPGLRGSLTLPPRESRPRALLAAHARPRSPYPPRALTRVHTNELSQLHK
ncbi:hypothetical protein NN561_001845 [Cricetulus griseus]